MIEQFKSLLNHGSIIAGLFVVLFFQFSLPSLFARDYAVNDAVADVESFNADLKKTSHGLYKEKMELMTNDPFSFFRGTPHLMYGDLRSSPSLEFMKKSPTGLIHGDLHAHNFAILFFQNRPGTYGTEDFDEVHTSYLAYDLFRLGVSINIGFRHNSKGKEIDDAIESMVQGYLNCANNYLHADWPSCPVPNFIEKFIKETVDINQKDFLDVGTKCEKGNSFKESKELQHLPKNIETGLRNALNSHFKKLATSNKFPPSMATILDVVRRLGKGLSSTGLDRYYVLLEGETESWKDDRVVEVKQMRVSSDVGGSLETQAKNTLLGFERAHRGHDIFLGVMPLDGKLFQTREIFPWAKRLEVTKVDKDDISKFAGFLGNMLGDFHSENKQSKEMKSWFDSYKKQFIKAVDDYSDQVIKDWKHLKDFWKEQ
ncbi:MAG: DUF2252 family protein [Candidatus Riflebacteria bacterium]|nr:DUF2252 family protein [Candidatus Riflebacteria bacterium]